MRKRAWLIAFAIITISLLLAVTSAAMAQQADGAHVVQLGDTLSGIARFYGVSAQAIADANRLFDPDRLYVGQRLIIPGVPEPAGETVHVVARGESLAGIAQRYGVEAWRLAAYNGILNPNLIYVGQKLRIPATGGARPTPTPSPTPPAGCLCEQIVIFGPTQNMTITSPVTVTGLGSGFEQTVVVAVLDGSGGRIGLTPATVVGSYGQQGAFTATVTFGVPANSQPGRIQVWRESPRDGAIEHLASVSVLLQGLELEGLLGKLDAAVKARDYGALQAVMAAPFQVSLYKGAATTLSPAQAVEKLQQAYLGPGAPRLDFSVDARPLLGNRVSFGPEVVHIVYSTGWGTNKNDDAFLLIGNVGGKARWSGMLYVPRELVDYRR